MKKWNSWRKPFNWTKQTKIKTIENWKKIVVKNTTRLNKLDQQSLRIGTLGFGMHYVVVFGIRYDLP